MVKVQRHQERQERQRGARETQVAGARTYLSTCVPAQKVRLFPRVFKGEGIYT